MTHLLHLHIEHCVARSCVLNLFFLFFNHNRTPAHDSKVIITFPGDTTMIGLGVNLPLPGPSLLPLWWEEKLIYLFKFWWTFLTVPSNTHWWLASQCLPVGGENTVTSAKIPFIKVIHLQMLSEDGHRHNYRHLYGLFTLLRVNGLLTSIFITACSSRYIPFTYTECFLDFLYSCH